MGMSRRCGQLKSDGGPGAASGSSGSEQRKGNTVESQENKRKS